MVEKENKSKDQNPFIPKPTTVKHQLKENTINVSLYEQFSM